MADRYNENDDVERGWREADRREGRYASDSDLDRGRGAYDREGRSFSPRREYERDYETGDRDFTGPRYGAGGYTGYGDSQLGERGQRASATRYSGDDGRYPIDREQYGASRDRERRYDQAFQGPRETHSEFGFGYDLDGADGRYRGEAARSHDHDRGFLGRKGRELFGLGEGVHRGRGPQGYRRSDERISEDVHERLTEDPHLDASAIGVTVNDGEVTLTGTVDSRDAKHHAEHLVERLGGVTHVQNNLRVDAHPHVRATGPTTNAATPLGENTKLSDQAAGKT